MKLSRPFVAFAAAFCLCLALEGAASGSTEAAPPNDNFADAIVLSGKDDSQLGDTNVDATREVGEPETIDNGPAMTSVWYVWTAPQDGQVTIDTETSSFDTLLAVYTGTAVGALVEVGANDDVGSDDGLDQTSLVKVSVLAGTIYRIRVDGFNGYTGTINLHLHEAFRPPNDNFANAYVLSGESAARAGDTNEAATLEAGEDGTVAERTAGASVWYAWTATASGSVRVDTATSDYDTLLGVYTGGSVGTLTAVASNDDADGLTSAVTFDAAPGVTYRIRVDGFEAATGTVNLSLVASNVPGVPANMSAIAGNGQATVSWTPPASQGGGAISDYELTRYVAGTPVDVTSVGVTTQATVSGLANGTTYTFRVAAKNAIGTGPRSAESNPVTPRTVPEAPTGVAAVAAPGQATVTWIAPASDGGSAITGYEVTPYVAGVAQGMTPVGAATQVTVTGLANGTTYVFRVAAVNAVGAGPQSADSGAVTPALPRFTLAVTKSGSGSGSVTSSAGGISCGAVCAADFDAGTTVTLTAAADLGSTFAGWSGACTGTGPCAVTVDAAKSAVAAFNRVPISIKVVCFVPNVKGKPLATARRRLLAAHCAAGTITKARSKRVAKGRVISQSRRPGTRLAKGSKVKLVVSRGRR